MLLVSYEALARASSRGFVVDCWKETDFSYILTDRTPHAKRSRSERRRWRPSRSIFRSNHMVVRRGPGAVASRRNLHEADFDDVVSPPGGEELGVVGERLKLVRRADGSSA